jgi:hypothetical protein
MSDAAGAVPLRLRVDDLREAIIGLLDGHPRARATQLPRRAVHALVLDGARAPAS